MWRSAIFFSAVATLASVTGAWAGTLLTVDEALGLAFPDAETRRESLFLTEEQLADVEARSGVADQGAIVTRFTARVGGSISGYAYLDTHRVRTLPETLMIIVAPDTTVRHIEVVAFREPMEYLPPDSWYRQIEGQGLSPELQLKRRVRPMTGATLTARATTDAARRVLAVHHVLASSAEVAP